MSTHTFWILVFLVCVSVNICAQVKNNIPEWKVLFSKESGVLMSVPASFSYTTDVLARRPGGSRGIGRGQFSNGSLYLYVFVDPVKGGDQISVVESFIKHNKQSSQSYSLGNWIANSYKFSDEDGYFHSIVRVTTKKRAYAFHALSRDQDDPSVEVFIKSILVSDVGFTPDQVNAKISATADGTRLQVPSGESIDQTDNAKREDSTADVGSTVPGATPTRSGVKPFKVLRLKKAGYTDFARFYYIQGIVTLSVTFESNGTVGSIVPITSLPFGLLRSSIEAAKLIKFEPEIKDGWSIATTKPVTFSFNIY